MTTKIISVDSTTSKIQVNDQDIATLSSVNGLGVSSINGGQLAGMRNRIINGRLDMAQRGTSFAASNGYGLDRFIFGATGGGVVTVSKQSDSPNDEFKNSLRVTVTTADTSIASTDIYALSQRIEGFNVSDLVLRTFTLSFWVRSSKLGTHCVSFKNSGVDRTWVAEYTINATNTWEKKSITVTGGLVNTGTWNFTNGIGLYVHFSLATGASWQTNPDSWQTGNFLTTANQVNCMDTIGNIFAVTGIQLESGSIATPFEHRSIGLELFLCQRYYTEVPVTPTTASIFAYTYLPASMRVSPTISLKAGVLNGATYGNAPYGLQAIRQNANSTGAIDANLALDAEL